MEFQFLLLYLYCVGSNGQGDAGVKKRLYLTKITHTSTSLLGGYRLVTRHVVMGAYMFRTYRTTSTMFYEIATNMDSARFTFVAEELHLNNVGECDGRDILVHLKYMGVSALNPDGYPFPKGYIDPDKRRGFKNFTLTPGSGPAYFWIEYPKPGIWYALAYIRWQDPSLQKAEGLGDPECHSVIYTDLQVREQKRITFETCYSRFFTINYNNIPFNVQCRGRNDITPMSLHIDVEKLPAKPRNISIRVRTESLLMKADGEKEYEKDYLFQCQLEPKHKSPQRITFRGYPGDKHLLFVDFTPLEVLMYEKCDKHSGKDFDGTEDLVELERSEIDQFSSFYYPRRKIYLSYKHITTARFHLYPLHDMGGNMLIEAFVDGQLGYGRKVVICLNIAYNTIPMNHEYCKFNNISSPATFVFSRYGANHGKLMIPYPDNGVYYMALSLFCDQYQACRCGSSNKRSKAQIAGRALNDTSLANITQQRSYKYQYRDPRYKTCLGTVIISAYSASCSYGRCYQGGTCGWNNFSGIVVSYCTCPKGYGGWDCGDDSRMATRWEMILATLLLTMSNLLLIFASYVAYIRLYYPEAVIYLITMFFSIFFHACDAPVQVNYCLIKHEILEFGDFYCCLLCFWITFLAMAIMGSNLRHFLKFIGAIVFAFVVTWDTESFIVILVPIAIVVPLLIFSWYFDRHRTNTWRFPRNYYTTFFPLGLLILFSGMAIYASFRMEKDYTLKHSFWHIVCSLTYVFFLPDIKRQGVKAFSTRIN